MSCKHRWHFWKVHEKSSGLFALNIIRQAYFICNKCGYVKIKHMYKYEEKDAFVSNSAEVKEK